MSSSPFTLRSDDDLIATFRDKDQKKVVAPKNVPYPLPVQHYYAWSEPSGVYTYLVFKRHDWEHPMGVVLARNGVGSSQSPAGMCDWCHHMGPSDQVGLLTTSIHPYLTGGTWLCLDLSCLAKVEDYANRTGKKVEKQIARLCDRIGEFFQRVRLDEK